MPRLIAFLAFRLVECLAVVLIVASLVFLIGRAAGDPITLAVPQTADAEEIERLKEQKGLNDPVVQQYVRFLGNVLTLDFGTSFRTSQPAIDEIVIRIPKTVQLTSLAMALSIVAGVSLGVLAAVKRGTPIDYLARFLALIGQATPSFWLGLMFIYLFAIKLGWLPTGGPGGPKHLILPAITLSMVSLAAIARLTRTGMLDVMQSDFIRTARAKGLAEQTVVWRHALRHALLPVLTIMGLQAGQLIAGAVVVETVFSWPGLGRLMITSITAFDFPVVQAGVIFISAVIVLANLMVDLCYRFLDPRIGAEGRA